MTSIFLYMHYRHERMSARFYAQYAQ
jgi:hypothetical protein